MLGLSNAEQQFYGELATGLQQVGCQCVPELGNTLHDAGK